MKTSVLPFISDQGHLFFNYHLNGKHVSTKIVERDLGLVVSADLSWRSHYQLISSRAFKMLGLIQRVFLVLCLTVQSALCIYLSSVLNISTVRSKPLYCSPVWHPYLLKDIECPELVQRRATKFICN